MNIIKKAFKSIINLFIETDEVVKKKEETKVELKDGKAVLMEDGKEFKIPELSIEDIKKGKIQKNCGITDYERQHPFLLGTGITIIESAADSTKPCKKQKRPYTLTQHSKLRKHIIHPGDLIYNYAVKNKKKLNEIAKEIGLSGWTIQQLVRHEYHLRTDRCFDAFTKIGFSAEQLKRLQKRFDKKAKENKI